MPLKGRGGNSDSGLPAISEGDAAKVLTVKADESGYELQTPSTGGADETTVLGMLWAFGD
jgi:hypothetical protein